MTCRAKFWDCYSVDIAPCILSESHFPGLQIICNLQQCHQLGGVVSNLGLLSYLVNGPDCDCDCDISKGSDGTNADKLPVYHVLQAKIMDQLITCLESNC